MKLTSYNNVWMKAGLYEIEKLCKGTKGWFTSDDLSSDLRFNASDLGMIGALFTAAVKAGLIVKVGTARSVRALAKDRKISAYRAAVYNR